MKKRKMQIQIRLFCLATIEIKNSNNNKEYYLKKLTQLNV